jgi:hypothetical protein
MVEPYCSPVSRLVYRFLHHEPADMGADVSQTGPHSAADPFDANNALPTLLFWRRPDLVQAWTPGLRLTTRRRFASLVYPLSGGFSKPALIPYGLAGAAMAFERLVEPVIAPLMAFRCLVVLERS